MVWRYRRSNTKKTVYKPNWGFSWGWEVPIWGVPVCVVAALTVIILKSETALDPYAPVGSEPPLDVQVVGYDWKWLFIYPDQHIATVGLLGFPADRPCAST